MSMDAAAAGREFTRRFQGAPGAETNHRQVATKADGGGDETRLGERVEDFAYHGGGGGSAMKTIGFGGAAVVVAGGALWGFANTEHIGPQDDGVAYNRITGEVENLTSRGNIYPLVDYNPFTTDIESVSRQPQEIGGDNKALHGVEIRTKDPVDTFGDFKLTYRHTDAANLVRYYGGAEGAYKEILSTFREVARTQTGSFSLTELQGIQSPTAEDGEAHERRNAAITALRDATNARLEAQLKEAWGEDAELPVHVVTINMRDVGTPDSVRSERANAAQATIALETAKIKKATAQEEAAAAAAPIKANAEANLEAADLEAQRLKTLEAAYSGLSPQTIEVMRMDNLEAIAKAGGNFWLTTDGATAPVPTIEVNPQNNGGGN